MTTQPAVLVTGGAGHVGSQVCKALHRSGSMPVTLDNLSTDLCAQTRHRQPQIGNTRPARDAIPGFNRAFAHEETGQG
jgi:UDP-glucose 4-epimerase